MPTSLYSINLTDRDLQILYCIYLLNGCSIAHIANKFFSGNFSTCYGRLSLLRAAGLIVWQRLGSTTGIGSGKALVSLPAKGREVLASEYLHVPASSVRPLKQISTAYNRDHHLLLCDFWIAM